MTCFAVGQLVDVVVLRESVYEMVLVLVKAFGEVGSHTNVQPAVLVEEDIDKIGLSHAALL